MKSLLTFCLAGLLMLTAIAGFPPAAQARSCHRHHGREICLERVQRSAKYHWRYRVSAQVDGTPQPLTRYNCRDRTRTPMEGTGKDVTVKFAVNGVGDLVCKLLAR